MNNEIWNKTKNNLKKNTMSELNNLTQFLDVILNNYIHMNICNFIV